MTRFRTWLSTLAASMRLTSLSGEPGAVTEVRRSTGPAITFEMSGDGETLHLHSFVAGLPDREPAIGALLETALMMNHAAEMPGPGVLAFDPRTRQLVYRVTMREDELESYEQLLAAIDSFALRLDEVAHELGALDLVGGGPGETRDDLDPMLLHSLFIRA